MQNATDTEVYKYKSEVVVEIRGVDSDGDFTVTSYQFSVPEDGSSVQPKGVFETQYVDKIETVLEDAGYILDES